jgi:hypothetical protein
MRKEDLGGLLVGAIMLVIALFVGLQIIRPWMLTSSIQGAAQYGFVLGTVAVGFIFNAVLIEVGHLLGAKLGGYQILSFNVLGLCIYRNNNRWAFGIRSYEGLTGETKITPRKEDAKPKLNLWGALFLFSLQFIAGMIAQAFIDETEWIRMAIIIVMAVGGMLMLYNYVPFKLDTLNDGYRLILITKGVNVKAYNELMRIERTLTENKPLENIQTFEEITTLTAQVNLYKIYQLLVEDKYEEAEKIIDTIIAQPEKLNETTNSRVYSQKIYIRLLNSTKEEGIKFYKDNLNARQKKFLSSDLSMASLRAYLLVAGLVEDSRSECVYVLERKKSALKRSIEPGRKEAELMLFNKALERVIKEHPDWDLNS